MSEELLFDSERQERKARRKTLLIPLLVLAAVIVLVVVIALIVRSGKAELHNAGENTLYPFTWEIHTDGSLLLELPHENAPDYRWTLVNGEELDFLLADRAEKEKDGKTCFTLTPTGEGRSLLELALFREARSQPAADNTAATGAEETDEDEDEPAADDIIYRMSLMLENTEADGRLVCTLLGVSGYQLQGPVSGGEDSENPYKVRTNENRELVITVQVQGMERDWVCEIVYGAESVVVDGLMNTPDSAKLYLKSGEVPGESELVLRSEAANAEIRFHCRTESDGALLLLDRQESYGEKPEQQDPAEGREQIATVPEGEEHEETWHEPETEPEFLEEPREQTEQAPAAEPSAETEAAPETEAPAETEPETEPTAASTESDER